MNTHRGIPIAQGVIYCQKCGFAHLDPLPSANTVTEYYEADSFYREHSPPDWFEKERQEYVRGDWNTYYGYLAKLLGSGPVLDIGCGAGWFIAYLRMNQIALALGVEPSLSARQFSPVKEFIFQDIPSFRGSIFLGLTLEHIVNPLAFLKETVMPHLDGRLVVIVPNEFNPLQRWVNRGVHKDWFVGPVHVNYFTGKSLQGLLEQAGLRVVDVGATFPMELFILMGLDYRGNDQLGRKCHRGRLLIERLFRRLAYPMYQRFYRQWRWGRELIMVAEKQ